MQMEARALGCEDMTVSEDAQTRVSDKAFLLTVLKLQLHISEF